ISRISRASPGLSSTSRTTVGRAWTMPFLPHPFDPLRFIPSKQQEYTTAVREAKGTLHSGRALDGPAGRRFRYGRGHRPGRWAEAFSAPRTAGSVGLAGDLPAAASPLDLCPHDAERDPHEVDPHSLIPGHHPEVEVRRVRAEAPP